MEVLLSKLFTQVAANVINWKPIKHVIKDKNMPAFSAIIPLTARTIDLHSNSMY
jgi:hypothetical protein